MNLALADVCTITMGQAPVGDSYNDRRQGLPLIAGAGDFKGGLLRPTKFTTKPGKISKAGDIVLSIRASIGAKVWTDGAYCLGRGVAGLRPGPELHDRYLWHWLTRFERDLASKGRGATFLQVNKSDIGEMPIALPALPEQRRIAAILDHADALRTKRREVLELLEVLRASIASDALGREPGGSAETVLGDIADVITGFAFPSSEFVGHGIKLCRGANVLPGRLDWSDLRCWSADDVNGLDRFALTEGDIVLALDRPWIGEGQKMARVAQSDLPSLLVQRVARIRATSGEFRELIWAALSSPDFQRHCRPTETTIPHISPIELRHYPIIVPSESKLSQLWHANLALENQRAVVTRHLIELESLFASLQARAFRGDL